LVKKRRRVRPGALLGFGVDATVVAVV